MIPYNLWMFFTVCCALSVKHNLMFANGKYAPQYVYKVSESMETATTIKLMTSTGNLDNETTDVKRNEVALVGTGKANALQANVSGTRVIRDAASFEVWANSPLLTLDGSGFAFDEDYVFKDFETKKNFVETIRPYFVNLRQVDANILKEFDILSKVNLANVENTITDYATKLFLELTGLTKNDFIIMICFISVLIVTCIAFLTVIHIRLIRKIKKLPQPVDAELRLKC